MIRQFTIDINKPEIAENQSCQDCHVTSNVIDISIMSKTPTEQEIFKASLVSFNMTNAGCQHCRSHRAFKSHGNYSRWMITWDEGKKSAEYVEIDRVKCDGCNKTHAVLSDIIIPYMQHTFLFVINAIKEYRLRSETGKTVAGICQERDISTTTLYTWIARFETHAELDLGAIATEEDVAARYWPPESAIMSGLTKEFYTRQGFSFMQYNKAATQSYASLDRVTTISTVLHKTGMEMREAINYPISVSKNTEMEDLNYGKSERPLPNGAVQVWADCAAGAENIPGCVSGGVLQAGSCVAVDPAGWDRADLRTQNVIEVGRALHGGWAGRVDQATTQGQRRHASTGSKNVGKNMRHQRTISKIAGDTS